jgi:hypothetical protein
VVAAGTVLSAVSVADANAQALLQAQALLECQWGNTEQNVTCPDDSGVEASEAASPVYSPTVAADTFFSTISQADANTQAQIFLAGLLECRYCNEVVAAKCVTGGSEDQTAEVPAGTFCETTIAAAQALAEALAAIPIKVTTDGEVCRYANDRVTAICVANVAFPNHLSKFPAGTVGLSANSTPYVVVEAGTFVVTTSKTDAQTQANALALASLDCFFDSEAKTFRCDPEEDDVPVSENATQPFEVAAGAFRSYDNRAEANAIRDAYGRTARSRHRLPARKTRPLDRIRRLNCRKSCPSGSSRATPAGPRRTRCATSTLPR